MNSETYRALAGLCGTHLLYLLAEELGAEPGSMPTCSCAVYVVVDSVGTVCYVGSVCRPDDSRGLAHHLSRYLRGLPKTQKWRGVYVLPLHPSTPEPTVRRLAGDIAGWLLPYDRERWPLAA